ncbi:MAG: hypothetical protein ACRC33_09250 [Gemmataceae bacterium]
MLPVLVLAALATDPAPKTDTEIANLQKERVKELREAYAAVKNELDARRCTFGVVREIAKSLRDAELETARTSDERVAILQAYLKAAVVAHIWAKAADEVGRGARSDIHLAVAERLKAELELRKAGGSPPKHLTWPATPTTPPRD